MKMELSMKGILYRIRSKDLVGLLMKITSSKEILSKEKCREMVILYGIIITNLKESLKMI